MSGSGKSTLAEQLYEHLERLGKDVEQLDGDILRGVFPNTGFSKEARDEHIARVGFMFPQSGNRFFIAGTRKVGQHAVKAILHSVCLILYSNSWFLVSGL
ncbi:MAG: adenylyl-sulfate kinase [Planctomycetota bacterium]